MNRKSFDMIGIVLSALMLVFMQSGCVEFVESDYSSGEYLTFKAALDGSGSSVKTRSISEHFTIEEEEWLLDLSAEDVQTKASVINTLDGYNKQDGTPSAGVFGYVSTTPWDDVQNKGYTFDGDEMIASDPPRWSTLPAGQGENARLYAYAPYIEGLTTKVISISDVASSQNDYIAAASAEIPVSSGTYEAVQLNFEHIYTAVRLKAGFDCTVNSITVSGIKMAGDYTIGTGWDLTGNDGEYAITFDSPLTVFKGGIIGAPVFMIPQELTSENAKLTVVTSDKNYSVSLTGREWEQGKLVTYTLNSPDDSKFIYFDLAAGNVTINASQYSGYVFVNGQTEAKPISGTHKSGNKYYVYQSCVTETNKSKGNYKVGYSIYDDVNKQDTGTLTLPSYEEVMYEGKRWRDFITNNTSVEAVIEAWDNSTGANGNTSIDVTKAVRTVGRESTQNLITVSGDVYECYLTLDNIYISTHPDIDGNRKAGSVTYTPTKESGSRLLLNLVGDSRVGCVHYVNMSKPEDEAKRNFLIFEGSGSITVADADFKKSSYNNLSGTGYYSNHYDSAIGGSDLEGYDDSYGIVINSGVIYAGTTKAENCTAIGAGGNGIGEVIINGGVVTAVASTTGTAIGGGIGFSSNGGQGIVEINGGNVYAYNKDNGHNIPSSAIGGAGSRDMPGASGQVMITGGNVYAESALGTAIGGGSSANKEGGSALVTISGGKVVAKGGTKAGVLSAGIGGGSSHTDKTAGTSNGGDATIKISGSPIIRTGSIGGGSPGKGSGSIGAAKVTVEGGDIQAQFVMAEGNENFFNMSGGVVRNSDTSDTEYKCIQENGGAVYMKVGEFTMSDNAVIKKCSASKSEDSKGGAVYIEGGTFNMLGGTIEQCSSNSHGGALYLEGGAVTLTGGTVSGNVATNGNGGAICINGGNFTMNGDYVNVVNNAAFDRNHQGTGNGGGIYITSAKNVEVNLLAGNITGNASGRYGGGVCVDMTAYPQTSALITVGDTAADGEPVVNFNSASLAGGGIYVYGSKAEVILNEGTVWDNSTSSHQVNPDIAVEGDGLVTLNGEDITTQSKITFSNNKLYYLSTSDNEAYQYVVSAVKNKLKPISEMKTDLKLTDDGGLDNNYKKFNGWYVKRNDRGDFYQDEAEITLEQNITLYASWSLQ